MSGSVSVRLSVSVGSGSGCAAAGVWADKVTMALVEPEGSNRLLQDVLARAGNETCADCGNPGKGGGGGTEPCRAGPGSCLHVAELVALQNPPSLRYIEEDNTCIWGGGL